MNTTHRRVKEIMAKSKAMASFLSLAGRISPFVVLPRHLREPCQKIESLLCRADVDVQFLAPSLRHRKYDPIDLAYPSTGGGAAMCLSVDANNVIQVFLPPNLSMRDQCHLLKWFLYYIDHRSCHFRGLEMKGSFLRVAIGADKIVHIGASTTTPISVQMNILKWGLTYIGATLSHFRGLEMKSANLTACYRLGKEEEEEEEEEEDEKEDTQT